MRLTGWSVLLAVLLLSGVSQAELVITEVMSSSDNPGGSANADWWELYNSGASAVDLSLYSWDDIGQEPGEGTFTNAIFPTMNLEPEQNLIICRETVGQESAWRTAWGLADSVHVINLGAGSPSLGNDDGIYIYDASDALVVSTTWGLQSVGTSRWWNIQGGDMGLSVENTYGAFKAAADGAGGPGLDIGSPGFVYVPEPSTLALMGLSMLLCMICRRKMR